MSHCNMSNRLDLEKELLMGILFDIGSSTNGDKARTKSAIIGLLYSIRIILCILIWTYLIIILPWNIHPFGGSCPEAWNHAFWINMNTTNIAIAKESVKHQTYTSNGYMSVFNDTICSGFWLCTGYS